MKMPVLIFLIMYITGVMLAFTERSNFKGYHLNAVVKAVLFLKVSRRVIYLHALIFQVAAVVMFMVFAAIYAAADEKTLLTVYNVYKWTSVIMFLVIVTTAAVDASIVERKRKRDEND